MKIKKFIAAVLIVSILSGISACSSETIRSSDQQSDLPAGSETISSTQETLEETSEETEVVDPSEEETVNYLEGYPTFEVTSEDLIDGVWNDDISNTHIGKNESPELEWLPVEGASEYVIYMVDTETNGFLHWKSSGITDTVLPRGWAPKLLEYNGPHVGHGYTHTYDIYVIALKEPAGRLRGGMNAVNPHIQDFILETDTDVNGNTGNIIAYGRISGEFTDARFRGVEPEGAYIM